MDCDRVRSFIEEDAVIADPQPEKALELTAELLDIPTPWSRSGESRPRCLRLFLFDRADLVSNVRMEADLLHGRLYSPPCSRT